MNFIQDIGKDFGKALVLFAIAVFVLGVVCSRTVTCIPYKVKIVKDSTP